MADEVMIAEPCDGTVAARHATYLAHFDARDTYGGYEIWRVQMAPGCRFEVFSDGECLM